VTHRVRVEIDGHVLMDDTPGEWREPGNSLLDTITAKGPANAEPYMVPLLHALAEVAARSLAGTNRRAGGWTLTVHYEPDRTTFTVTTHAEKR